MAADPARTRRVTRSMVALFLAIPLAIAVGAALVSRSLLARSNCSNEVRAERVAPDGAHLAVVFVRTCGAEAPASTNVSILRSSKALPDKAGNLLVLEGEQPLNPEWRDAHSLVLTIRRGVAVSWMADEVSGVRASLEEL